MGEGCDRGCRTFRVPCVVSIETPIHGIESGSAPLTQIIRKEIPRDTTFEPRAWQPTRRPPGYVPYIVDNLWEWTRPEGMPNRRHSVFAAPRPETIQVEGEPFRVKIESEACIAQIELEDARGHRDCKNLSRLVLKLLGRDWPTLPVQDRAQLAPLWMPCLTAEEVDQILSDSPLAEHKDELSKALTFWADARQVKLDNPLPFPDGEVFFEAESWRLGEL